MKKNRNGAVFSDFPLPRPSYFLEICAIFLKLQWFCNILFYLSIFMESENPEKSLKFWKCLEPERRKIYEIDVLYYYKGNWSR